ncbi:MAG: alpha/beta hydrolase-fold protein [Ignavibacterium album]|jgi:predicted alpha/beta superfamily hydrolase|uniref:alpha/beta hydrolase n=1 Tax=Ignavibacterium album TaxID=591197 RepID=UPI0026ED8FF6|nr:alpha/beta hydrolase-fold protein [Ignavibacterium album]MCX8104668.1 alpha/beta hydrolase-fold protein [Ignavibacterium album]
MFRAVKKKQSKINTERDEIVGTVKYHRAFSSSLLDNKRDIIVWLPKGYNSPKKKDKRYAVLYMHDGQNILDPKTSYAGKDWRVDETLSKLIRKRKVKDVIVVGIYNTPDRLDEYSWSDKGKLYLKFIIEELKPFIDSNYRTLTDRENTAMIGSSMGGLISFYAGWFHNDVFSKVGCMSSSFYYQHDQALKIVEEYDGPKKNVKFYIDHGEDGLVRGQKMFGLLTQKGYVLGQDIDYYYAPGAEHNEKEWAARLERPLLFFFRNS